jgi:serine/threonine protein kinase
MTLEELRRIRAIAAAALERDPEERSEYLDRACGGQPELRARVDELLRTYDTRAEIPEAVEGKVIGPYIVRRILGQGGMGVVYLADDTRLARLVALKALAPGVMSDPLSRKRLRHEARAAAGLAHPGIATVYALEEIGDELYMACEYVPGEPLRALLASGPLPIPQVVTIGAQLARALVAAHTLGVVHRDIKPENVVRTPSGIVKVLDFGLARMEGPAQTKLTQTGMVVGTPAYMAPEQARGEKVDFRTDLFSAGLLLYELASGINPFAANTITATLARIAATDEAPPLCNLRPDSLAELDRILATCLRKNPAERYSLTQELVTDFEQLEAQIAGGSARSGAGGGSGSRIPGSVDGSIGPPAGNESNTTARWWWSSHQLIVSAFYILTIYPTWYSQRWLGDPWGMLFLLCVLGAAAVGTSLRLHLRFIAAHSPAELTTQLPKSHIWTRCSDAVFSVSLLAGALGMGAAHPEFAMMFVTVATAIIVAGLVIEPTSEKAAFGTPAGGS